MAMEASDQSNSPPTGWCTRFWRSTERRFRALGRLIFNSNRREVLGRDGRRWSKLAAFYFFFYLALAGFFSLYLSIFMLFLPLNQPRCTGKASRLTSRANPLSPGLSFRPQASFDPTDVRALISISTGAGGSSSRRQRSTDEMNEIYTKNLDEFLQIYYNTSQPQSFSINDVGNCTSTNQYGFRDGKPCILIKMNKIADFVPEVGLTKKDNQQGPSCSSVSNLPVRCTGEHLFDQETLGEIKYYSESGSNDVCGSIDEKHFPYRGKEDRKDRYQAPYVWVQFTHLKPHVLISVECRIFGSNLFYDRPTQRAAIRFQLYLDK